MSGEHVRDHLDAYLDGELSPELRILVEQHLAACQECQGDLPVRRQLHDDLRREVEALATDIEPLVQATLRGLEKAPVARPLPPPRLSDFVRIGTGIAAGLVLALLVQLPMKKHAGNELGSMVTRIAGGSGLSLPFLDEKRLLAVGDVIPDTPVQSPLGVRAEIRTPTGSRIRLGEDTTLIFEDGHPVALKNGSLWIDGAIRLDGRFGRVESDGGRFVLLSRGSFMDIVAIEGRVTLESPGQTRTLLGGQKCSVGSKGESPVVDELFPERHLADWIPLLLDDPDRAEARDLARRSLVQLGDGKLAALAEDVVLRLGPAAREPLLGVLQAAIPPSDTTRQAAGRLLPRVFAPDCPESHTDQLFDLLADRDGIVRSQAAEAITEVTAIPSKEAEKFWRGASGDRRAKAAARWRKAWKASRQ